MTTSLLRLLVLALLLQAGSALAWWNDEWTFRQKVSISVPSANESQAIKDVPILVRLHTGNFSFLDAREDGADLRFVATDDKTLLPFQIESYDAVNELALVWVHIPQLTAGSLQSVWLYSGNPKAAPAGDASSTFDSVAYSLLSLLQR